MKLYDYADEQIMNVVNLGVKAWNWTTGGSKFSLSNILHISGSLLAISSNDKPIYDSSSLFFSGALAGCNWLAFNVNKIIERREKNISDQNVLDLQLEGIKGIYHTGACTNLLAGLPLTGGLKFKELDEFNQNRLGIGLLGYSLSMYVSRADNPKPRKNVISRSVDSFKKWYVEQSEPSAQPAFTSFYLSGLESKI